MLVGDRRSSGRSVAVDPTPEAGGGGGTMQSARWSGTARLRTALRAKSARNVDAGAVVGV